jgi:ABC-type nitrate/sulfonate/bicarbonate transport system substrate-binding protein
VASSELVKSVNEGKDARLQDLFEKLDKGIEYFDSHHEEAIAYISTELDYSKEDAAEWLKTVKFATKTQGVDVNVVKRTVELLKKASVIGEQGMHPEEMIGKHSGAQV